jgi:biotin synthase
MARESVEKHYAEVARMVREAERDEATVAYAAQRAVETSCSVYGNDVFTRGLVEFSSYCKNDCLYCGLRCSNKRSDRYRLTLEQILECADDGYLFGYRTFVLQSGEDPHYTDEMLCDIIMEINSLFGVADSTSYRWLKEYRNTYQKENE